ncbi:Negative elongation factor A, partial [Pseudolycoriella hygida]
MACISDTSLWLHNKLGTSNDSWTSGSICSQLSKEVLRNIKECFSDLQTQVKLKLLLSFFHIPRRLVEEWKNELEEIIEIAGLDTELWVSMIAETIKTFPNTGSLNTEISDYEETRPIFSDMVNDLRKLINKHSDIGMLPLECQYLNKAALISVVGQQPPPVKHFTIKKKPKSATLKTELLQKCMDAQSIKKTSAPTIPLRTRGMPRKMTDTTPLKGIPSRVPTSGFRTPTSSQGQNRPNMSRTPAGRKDGGIKLLDIADQPLGYAAAKKRKRQQELEDQQKRALEAASNPPVKLEPLPVTTTPDYAAGLTASTIYTQPATPASVIKEAPTTTTTAASAVPTTIQFVKSETVINDGMPIKAEVIKVENSTTTTTFANQTENNASTNNNNQIVFAIKSPNSNKTSLTNSGTTIVSNVNSIKQESPRIVQQNQNSSMVVQQQQQSAPTSTQSYITPPLAAYNQSNVAKQKINVQSVISSLSAASTMPTLTALSSNSSIGQQQIITQSAQQQQQIQIPQQIGATKIVQIKTAPTIQMANAQRTTIQNIPPLIPTQQPTILNIRNVSIAGRPNQIQTTNASNISYITTNS